EPENPAPWRESHAKDVAAEILGYLQVSGHVDPVTEHVLPERTTGVLQPKPFSGNAQCGQRRGPVVELPPGIITYHSLLTSRMTSPSRQYSSYHMPGR